MNAMPVTTDVITLLGGAAAGSAITQAVTIRVQAIAARRAAQAQARDLLSQIVSASATMESEKAVFRERRDSWRPNALAAGQALVEFAAAYQDGNWVRGIAAGIRGLREWDATEGARFVERMQAAASQVNPALVSLSLLSPQLNAPCSRVVDALAEAVNAQGRKNAAKAEQDLIEAMAELRAAVSDFMTNTKRRRLRHAKQASSAERKQIFSADKQTPSTERKEISSMERKRQAVRAELQSSGW